MVNDAEENGCLTRPQSLGWGMKALRLKCPVLHIQCLAKLCLDGDKKGFVVREREKKTNS